MLALPPAQTSGEPGDLSWLGDESASTAAAAAPAPLPAATAAELVPDYDPPLLPLYDPAVRRGAAVAVLASTAGLAAGGVFGGAYGAAAGLLAGGAAVNLIRTWKTYQNPICRAESVKSGIVGVLGLGVAGYLVYLAARRSD